ncbi:MAG TPA: substrate-binding domain-containing protein [Thermohalobaculum sp.]|nr:substrate-binding domain-containing protein [Thermohalobaculum sp.]
MKLKFARAPAVTALSLAAFLTFGTAHAQLGGQVTLTSIDGNTSIGGELIEFDGLNYRLRTALGEVEISVTQVRCEGPGCPEEIMFGATFSIHGTSTIGLGLMPKLVEGYAEHLQADLVRETAPDTGIETIRVIHEDGREMASIHLLARNSDIAFDSIAAGRAAIGMSSRPVEDAEVGNLVAAGEPDPRQSKYESVLAHDAIVAIVNPSNNVRILSIEEMANILAGNLTNWSQVGGADMPITVHANDPASGNIDFIDEHVLRPNNQTIGFGAKRYTDDLELTDAVLADPGAIGFTSSAHVDQAIALGIEKSCGITSFPTDFAIKTEEYPLTRRLYLYRSAKAQHLHVYDLMAYMVSDLAQPLIDEAGFVSRSIERNGLNVLGQRIAHALIGQTEFSLPVMQQMLTSLNGAERLSLTFHFRPGSNELEVGSKYEAQQFAQAFAQGDYAGREVVLVGFSGSDGDFDTNRAMSMSHAEAALAAMRDVFGASAFDQAPVVIEAYGEMTPIGCNDTLEGQNANHRVEVWLRPKKHGNT